VCASSLSDLAFGGSLRTGGAAGFRGAASDSLLTQRDALRNSFETEFPRRCAGEPKQFVVVRILK
jgi:hypothetical protein